MFDGRSFRYNGRCRLMLVDDHALVRTSIRYLLESFLRFEVTYEVSSGREAVDRIAEHPIDLVLMDISMPVMDGIEATAELRRAGHSVPVLMLSMHDAGDYALRALEAGANGYCVKSASQEELIRALDGITSGLTYLSPNIQDVGATVREALRNGLLTA